MPVSRADYETAATNPASPPGAGGDAPTLSDTKTAAGGLTPALNPWVVCVTAAAAAMTELVKQTKELQEGIDRQITSAGGISSAPAMPQTQPINGGSTDGRTTTERVPPPDRGERVESPMAKAGNGLGNPAIDGASESPRFIPPGPAAPEEQTQNIVLPEWCDEGRDLKTRFDKARGHIQRRTGNTDEMQTLFDQAVTLLESLAQQPALQGYETLQRRLDLVEQLLGQTANTRG